MDDSTMGIMLVGLYVFVLATLAGREVIGKVPPTLHTPLMSGANAISGIAIVGALVVTAQAETMLVQILGVVGITMATINVVGGFMVTDRMLQMFRKG
jgi:NAD(P) transhydrogenase subunit alpha